MNVSPCIRFVTPLPSAPTISPVTHVRVQPWPPVLTTLHRLLTLVMVLMVPAPMMVVHRLYSVHETDRVGTTIASFHPSLLDVTIPPVTTVLAMTAHPTILVMASLVPALTSAQPITVDAISLPLVPLPDRTELTVARVPRVTPVMVSTVASKLTNAQPIRLNSRARHYPCPVRVLTISAVIQVLTVDRAPPGTTPLPMVARVLPFLSVTLLTTRVISIMPTALSPMTLPRVTHIMLNVDAGQKPGIVPTQPFQIRTVRVLSAISAPHKTVAATHFAHAIRRPVQHLSHAVPAHILQRD